MLALLALFGAVGAGLVADSLIRSQDPDTDEDPEANGEEGTTETEDSESSGSMLTWALDDDDDALSGDLAGAEDSAAPLALTSPGADVTADGTPVDDGMPTSDDIPDPAPEAILREGGSDDDILSGDGADDTLAGGAGNDQLTGRGGDDRLMGGSGGDHLEGGDGDDNLMGHGGNDVLIGGAGDDVLSGGRGADSLAGSEGDDRLVGGNGADTLNGGEGQDSLNGGMGRDWLVGGAGDDLMIGGGSQDSLDGGTGDDTLIGGFQGRSDASIDVLNGGEGNDLMVLGAGDIAMGGDGADQFELTDHAPDLPLAEIVDYNPAEDEIVVVYDADQHDAPELTTEPVEGSDDVTLLLDGVAVALIRNAGALDLSQITLRAG